MDKSCGTTAHLANSMAICAALKLAAFIHFDGLMPDSLSYTPDGSMFCRGTARLNLGEYRDLQRDEANFPSAATFSVVKILEYFSNILDKEAGRRRWGKCEVGRRVKQSTL